MLLRQPPGGEQRYRDSFQGDYMRLWHKDRLSTWLLRVVLACSWCWTSWAQTGAPVIVTAHGPNASEQLSKHYVVLVSLDGFRYDYAKLYHAEH
jgi:hypothetical protein